MEEAKIQRDNKFMNKHLTMVENETYLAIKYGDSNKLQDLGPKETINLGFKIEISKGVYSYPLLLACASGQNECVEYML